MPGSVVDGSAVNWSARRERGSSRRVPLGVGSRALAVAGYAGGVRDAIRARMDLGAVRRVIEHVTVVSDVSEALEPSVAISYAPTHANHH